MKHLRRSFAPNEAKKRSSSSSALLVKNDEVDQPVGYMLRRAYYAAKANTARLIKDLNITPTQASAVMALDREGTLSQAELGRNIGMEPANVHSLVARLSALGFVELQAHPDDQRQTQIVLAKHGQRQASQLVALTRQSSEKTLSVLNPNERALFISLLKRVAFDQPESLDTITPSNLRRSATRHERSS